MEGSLHTRGIQDPKSLSLDDGRMGMSGQDVGCSLLGDLGISWVEILLHWLNKEDKRSLDFPGPSCLKPLSYNPGICKGQMVLQGLKIRLSHAVAHVFSSTTLGMRLEL